VQLSVFSSVFSFDVCSEQKSTDWGLCGPELRVEICGITGLSLHESGYQIDGLFPLALVTVTHSTVKVET